MAPRAPLVPLELPVRRDHKVIQAHRDQQVRRVILVRRVQPDLPDRKGRRVKLAHKARPVQPELRDRRVHRVQ